MSRRHNVVTLGILAVVGYALIHAGQPVPIGVVASGSMAPTLEAGDVFVALPPTMNGIATDDIIVFRDDTGWTVHRVVEMTADGVITAGDANPFIDQARGAPPVAPDAIAGVVPIVAGRPLAMAVPVDRPTGVIRILLAVGGCLVVVFANRTDDADGPSPRLIGGAVALAVMVAWLGATGGGDSPTAATITNAGWFPRLVVTEGAAVTLFPGESTDVDDLSRTAVLPSVAPQRAIDGVAAIDPVGPVFFTAGALGGLTYGILRCFDGPYRP